LNAMETADLGALSTAAIRGLTTAQIMALGTDDLAVLTTAQFSALASADIGALSTTQIAALSTADIVALTSTQIDALTTSHIAALTTTQVVALEAKDIATMTSTQIAAFETADIAVMSAAQLDAMMAATPLVLDLDGNGVSTLAAAHGVRFDINATGHAQQVGWAAATDGLLVRDLNQDGQIDNGRELFGAGTALANGQRAGNGYAALAALDSNHDGKITQADAAYGELKVWVDRNSDGVTETGELKSLADLGIVSMDLRAQTGTTSDHGNLLGLTSSYTTADGSSHQMADVWFAKQGSVTDATPTVSTADTTAHPTVAASTGSPAVHDGGAHDAATAPVSLGDVLAAAPTEILPDSSASVATANANMASSSAPPSAHGSGHAAMAASATSSDADLALALQQHQAALDDLLRQQPLI
ncbi:MAG TPA: heme utilization protein, partial [Burkholderiaceae bacterium]|nr:heme utilization protein [Burkholderiaceae bacterium]